MSSAGAAIDARRGTLGLATGLLLAGPTALAFFAGGYFTGPRVWAGVGCWVAVALAVAAGRPPRGGPALVAIGGLGLLAAWTLVSIVWAPIRGDAYAAGQIVVMYTGALLAATIVLRGPRLVLVEPVLAAGALLVIGYGLSERLLPGALQFARSVSAEGRLEQPLTYWNAMGELAALGFVLSVRLAGDTRRPAGLRAGAAAACAPLGMGLYITFSRGALFACAAGLVTLVVAAPQRPQLGAALRGLLAGGLLSAVVAGMRGITAMAGPLATRERQGAIGLVALVVIAGIAGIVQHRLAGRERTGPLGLPRRAPLTAATLICAGLALAIVVGAHESSGASATLSGGATRLVSLQSNRYAYWAVALRAFASEPLHGIGAGGWGVEWLRWRTVNEFVQDAHSLELQTLAELGVVGLALLLACFAGVAAAARRALRSPAAAAAAGPTAVAVVYLAHSPLDWDWQMPAVTLVAIVAAGALVALADDAATATAPQSSSAIRGASRRKIHTAKTHTAT